MASNVYGVLTLCLFYNQCIKFCDENNCILQAFFKILVIVLLKVVFCGLQRQKVDGWYSHNVHLGLLGRMCA